MINSKIFVSVLTCIFMLGFMAPLLPAQAARISTLTWSSGVFEESAANDGSISSIISINLEQRENNVQFLINDDMVAAGMVKVTGLPAGLTCVVDSSSGNYCRIILEGQAVDHEFDDSIGNLNIEFLAPAFTNGDTSIIENVKRTDIQVIFEDALDFGYDGRLTWNETVFAEDDADDGSIGNSITVTLTLDIAGFEGFRPSADMIAEERAIVENLPAGLTCLIAYVDSTHCQISLQGRALDHEALDSIDNLKIEFLDGAFFNYDAAWIKNSSNNKLEINFAGDEVVISPIESVNAEASLTVGSTAYIVNGVANEMDVAPYAESGRIYVPVRYLAYCLGMTDANVVWDPIASTATITEGDKIVILQLGKPWMYVNNTPQQMDAVPQARDNRIFLPARFVVEAFGGSVSWDQATSTVTINRIINQG